MKYFSVFFMLFCVASCAPLKKLADLPTSLKENSGMIYSDTTVWLHNDSGNAPFLYQVKLDGTLLRSVKILGAQNIDWEDLSKDAQGNWYIGDFGNNNNNRKNLCVYKIPNLTTIDADSIAAMPIEFHYPDQKSFPPSAAHRHFDMEAMVAWQDSLYLFTKNRTQPNDGWIKMYVLPNMPGKYEAHLVDSIQIKPRNFLQSTTAAAISPDGKKLALLSMSSVRIFSLYKNNHFLHALMRKRIKLPFSQKEAIDFIDNRTLLISDEKSPLGKAHLYLLKIP